MPDHVTLHSHFPVSPADLYDAWLDSALHSEFTGGEATISRFEGGRFSACDSYISGTNLELKRPSLIVQTWRTTDFAPSDPDSRLELRFSPSQKGGTDLTLNHENLPDGTGQDYQQGWLEYYFTPMQEYFTLHPDEP